MAVEDVAGASSLSLHPRALALLEVDEGSEGGAVLPLGVTGHREGHLALWVRHQVDVHVLALGLLVVHGQRVYA